MTQKSEKIQRSFVREEAYLKLRNWIVEGRLEPGQKLRDKDLAQQMGVSRTPIREALLRLEEEGLIQTKPNSSTLVCPIDSHNALHLFSIVWSLEKLALEQAFTSITTKDIQTMIEANEKLSQALQHEDLLAALQADITFHAAYIYLAHNPDLERILSNLKQKLRRLDLYYFEKVKEAHRSYDEHQLIIEALQQKDLPGALSAIENNWKASLSRIYQQQKPIKPKEKK